MDISINLQLKNGDFDILSDSLLQDETSIIVSDKGQIINNLLLGVGITKYLNGPANILSIKNDIQVELKKDKIIASQIQVINGELNINSYRK